MWFCTGDYAGSWTWFEANIVRGNDDTLPAPNFGRMICHELEKRPEERWSEIITVQRADKSDAWHIQRNVRASGEFRTHVIVWSADDETEEEESGESLDMTGRGNGSGFIKALQPTDRIAVIARAMVCRLIDMTHL